MSTVEMGEIADTDLVAEDWELNEDDAWRLRTVQQGDPVSDYFGAPEVQRRLLAEEKAAARLGLHAAQAEIAQNAGVLETLKAAERLQGVIEPSPLMHAARLSERLGNSVVLKLENVLQPAFTFKVRGAYNKIASLTDEERARGILAVSTGNHAQGVAFAAAQFGIPATIVMPENAPDIKQTAAKRFGANIVLFGQNYTESCNHIPFLQAEAEEPMTLVHPFNDPLVIAGQGTVGKELLEQRPDMQYVFLQIGGGGLISGVARYLKTLRPDINIIGVEPQDSACASAARKAGRPIVLDTVGTFADSLSVKEMGDLTHELVDNYVDDIITVNSSEIVGAMQAVFDDTRTVVEPSGAVGLAGLMQFARIHQLRDKSLAAVCTGGNIALGTFLEVIASTMQP